MSLSNNKKIKVFGYAQKNHRNEQPPVLVLDQSHRTPTKEQSIDHMLIESNQNCSSYLSSPKHRALLHYQHQELQKYLGLASESHIHSDQHFHTRNDQCNSSRQMPEHSLSQQLRAEQWQKGVTYSPICSRLQSQPQFLDGIQGNNMVETPHYIGNEDRFDRGKELLFYTNSATERGKAAHMNSSSCLSNSNSKIRWQQSSLPMKVMNTNSNASFVKTENGNPRYTGGQAKSNAYLTIRQLKSEYKSLQQPSQRTDWQEGQYRPQVLHQYRNPYIAYTGQQREQHTGRKERCDNARQKSLRNYLAQEQDYGRQIQTMISKYHKVAQLRERTKDITKQIHKLNHKQSTSQAQTQPQTANGDYYCTDFTKELCTSLEVQFSKGPNVQNLYASDPNWRISRTSQKLDEQLKRQLRNMENLIDKFRDISQNMQSQQQRAVFEEELQIVQPCLQSNIMPFNINIESRNDGDSRRDDNSRLSQRQDENPDVASEQRQKMVKADDCSKGADNEKQCLSGNQYYSCGCRYHQISQEIKRLKQKINQLQSQRKASIKQHTSLSPVTSKPKQKHNHKQQHTHLSSSPDQIKRTHGTQLTVKKVKSGCRKSLKQQIKLNKAMYSQTISDYYDSKAVLSKYMSEPKIISKTAPQLAKPQLQIPQRPQRPEIKAARQKLRVNLPQLQCYPRVSSSEQDLIRFGEYMYSQCYRQLSIHFDKKYREPSDNFRIKKYSDCIHYYLNNSLDLHLIYYYRGKLYFGQIVIKKEQYLKHGIGLYCNLSKYTYLGQFRNDKKHGHGAADYFNGDSYEGSWSHGKKQGRGVLVDSIGDFYEGMFANDKKEGKGFQQLSNGDCYEGDFQGGKLSGEGLYWWKDGSFYRGSFKSGLLDGRGFWVSRQMDYYEGEYKDNKKDGMGTYYWNNGAIFSGRFINDVYHAPLI